MAAVLLLTFAGNLTPSCLSRLSGKSNDLIRIVVSKSTEHTCNEMCKSMELTSNEASMALQTVKVEITSYLQSPSMGHVSRSMAELLATQPQLLQQPGPVDDPQSLELLSVPQKQEKFREPRKNCWPCAQTPQSIVQRT